MDPVVLRAGVVLAVIALAYVAGRWWQRRDGEVREGRGGFVREHLQAVGLDPRGDDVVALLLGSPTCAPCVTVKRILSEVVEARPSFRWVYVDAADHLDIADAHHVMRVPTLFVLDADGRILARTSGVPTTGDLLDVLDRGSERARSAA